MPRHIGLSRFTLRVDAGDRWQRQFASALDEEQQRERASGIATHRLA